MKQLYTSAILLIVSILTVTAQTTDTLRREVTIVKDFTPQLRKANKINTLPPINTPSFTPRPVNYSFLVNTAEVATTPGNINIPCTLLHTASTKINKGYVQLAAGSYRTACANAGYRIIDNEKNSFNIALQYNTIDGKMHINSAYIPITDETTTRQTLGDTRLGLHYGHRFDNNISLGINAAYRYINFNYYGTAGDVPIYQNSNPFQTVNNFLLQWRVDSDSQNSESPLKWNLNGGYTFYGNSTGAYISEAGNENHAYLNGGFINGFNDKWSAGVDVELDFLHYNKLLPSDVTAQNIATTTIPTAVSSESLFMARFRPHISCDGDKVSFKAGVKVDISANDGPVFSVAPDVKFDWEFVRNHFFFIDMDGGKQLHTWDEMSQYCLYFDPSHRLPSTYSPLDAMTGFKLNFHPDISVQLYGGYEIAEDALFQQPAQAAQAIAWQVIKANCIKAGGHLDVSVGSLLDIEADIAYRQWKKADKVITYNRPKWVADLRATLHAGKKLDFEVRYNMQLDRDFDFLGSLADIHNLQAAISYRPINALSIFVNGNNLLNRKYDYYYGLPAPQIQVMAGIGVKF